MLASRQAFKEQLLTLNKILSFRISFIPQAHAEGHTVFYDMAGWFTVFYTNNQGIMINCLVSVFGLIMIGSSLYIIQRETQITYNALGKSFVCIFAVQILSVILAFAANFAVAFFLDATGSSLSWYSHMWILFGLYFCPFFFLLGIGQAVLCKTKFISHQKFSINTKTQMILHSHCLILIMWLIIMTSLGIRSSFMIMISVFFYVISVFINLLLNRYYKHGKSFA